MYAYALVLRLIHAYSYQAYSSPSIMAVKRMHNGSRVVADDFREAYWWGRGTRVRCMQAVGVERRSLAGAYWPGHGWHHAEAISLLRSNIEIVHSRVGFWIGVLKRRCSPPDVLCV